MQAKIIELKQAPVVLVELEERPTKVEDSFANGFIYTDEKGYVESFYLDDICEDSKLIGLLSDLTEEQFAQFAIKMTWGGDAGIYVDHTNPSTGVKMSAKESVYSMLKSESVYTENPVKVHTWASENADEYYRIWEEAQSRTIDPKRTVVLIKRV